MLNKVTITGADDSIDPEELIAISREHPYVEWAILFSASRAGTQRYPTIPWIVDFAELADKARIELAAHFCGRVARETQDCNVKWLRLLNGFGGTFSAFRRVQLNGLDFEKGLDLRELHNRMLGIPRLILQARSEDHLPLTQKIIGNVLNPPSVLFDVSGGRGIAPDKWPIYNGHLSLGYAGGIGPENAIDVVKELTKTSSLRANPYFHPFWIDMESGVRTDDKFDLMKVRDVLSKIAPYVNPKYATTFM